jgi:hypothetical protein
MQRILVWGARDGPDERMLKAVIDRFFFVPEKRECVSA